MQEKYKRRRL